METRKARLAKEGPSPRKETHWTCLLLRELARPPRTAQHIPFEMQNPPVRHTKSTDAMSKQSAARNPFGAHPAALVIAMVAPVLPPLCGIRVYSMTMSGTCATHVLTKAKPKAVWSRRLRCEQVSRCWWSVNCCVQACKQTQRDTQGNETREMCSCWGYKQHSSSRNSREWRDSNFQQSSRLANL